MRTMIPQHVTYNIKVYGQECKLLYIFYNVHMKYYGKNGYFIIKLKKLEDQVLIAFLLSFVCFTMQR